MAAAAGPMADRFAHRFAAQPVFGGEDAMTVCPIAIAVGCKKCPVFAVCPLKGVIGDYRKEGETKAARSTKGKAGKARK